MSGAVDPVPIGVGGRDKPVNLFVSTAALIVVPLNLVFGTFLLLVQLSMASISRGSGVVQGPVAIQVLTQIVLLVAAAGALRSDRVRLSTFGWVAGALILVVSLATPALALVWADQAPIASR